MSEIKIKVTAENNTRDLTNSLKMTAEDIKGTFRKAGEESGDHFFKRFSAKTQSLAGSALSPVGDLLGESIGARAGLAAAGTLLPALGGALSAGAGAAGLGGGLALAIFSDSELKDAGKKAGDQLFGQITQRAHTAFYEPIKVLFNDLGRYSDTIADDWGDAFDNLAPSLVPFVNDVAQAVTQLSGVLADIAGDSGPALEALGDGLKEIFGSVGDLMVTLTSDTEGNADALRMFLGVVSDVVDGVNLLVEAQQNLADVTGGMLGIMGPLGDVLQDLGQSYLDSKNNAQEWRAINGESADSASDAATQIREEIDALSGLADALKAQTDPAFAMIAAQKELADAQEAYSKAVKKSGKNSSEAQDALIDLTKAALNVESAAESAGDAFDGSISPALRATMKAASLTEGQIDQVAKAFRGARKAGLDFEDKYTGTVQQRGAEAAKRAIAAAAAAARAYEGQYIAALSVRISRMDAGMDGPQAGGKATGGIVGQAAHGATSSGLTWVGEQGPELIKAPAGTRVWSAADSFRIRRTFGNAGWQGPLGNALGATGSMNNSQPLMITLNVDGRAVAVQMVDPFRQLANEKAGGVIQNLLGSL